MRYLSILSIFFLVLTNAVRGQSLKSADEYSQRGMARFEKNDLDGAIADFTKVIEMNGQKLEFCYYFRGMAQYRKGNPEQAILDLSKAIGIKADPRFYDDRGNLLARQGKLDRAIADLNRAIELAPRYAKAYGDRGIIRLMHGEETDAELDFKKCFELDAALESQFRASAKRVKQRAVSPHAYEKPFDVEIIKFSWTEGLSQVLVPSAPTIGINTSPVSASGTRVLADPTAKGEPGPSVVSDSSGMSLPSSVGSAASTRDAMEYKFFASLRNTGSKTIVAVKWAYFFEPRDLAHEGLAYLFMTKTDIKPGKEKTLKDSIPTNSSKGSIKMPHKNNQAIFNERVVILRLDYADGSSWESSEAPGGPQKSSPRQ